VPQSAYLNVDSNMVLVNIRLLQWQFKHGFSEHKAFAMAIQT
jgi:hypothetical protein